MPATYEKIQTHTLPSNATSYTFTVISQAYTDLVLVATLATTSGAASSVLVQVGDGTIDTGNNYSRTRLLWNGSLASSANRSSAPNVDFDSMPPTSTTSRTTTLINFQNYSNTTTNKTFLIRNNNAGDYSLATVGLWHSTAKIDQVKITADTNSIASGSTFTLYGIEAA